jgi:hypothetical protein
MVFSFFGSFAPHFQIKCSTHGSNLNSILVMMSELEFFCLWSLNSKLQNCGSCKISWKNSKTSHLDLRGHIEGDIIQNHEQPLPPSPTGQKCAQIVLVVLPSCNFQWISTSYTVGLNEKHNIQSYPWFPKRPMRSSIQSWFLPTHNF